MYSQSVYVNDSYASTASSTTPTSFSPSYSMYPTQQAYDSSYSYNYNSYFPDTYSQYYGSYYGYDSTGSHAIATPSSHINHSYAYDSFNSNASSLYSSSSMSSPYVNYSNVTSESCNEPKQSTPVLDHVTTSAPVLDENLHVEANKDNQPKKSGRNLVTEFGK